MYCANFNLGADNIASWTVDSEHLKRYVTSSYTSQTATHTLVTKYLNRMLKLSDRTPWYNVETRSRENGGDFRDTLQAPVVKVSSENRLNRDQPISSPSSCKTSVLQTCYTRIPIQHLKTYKKGFQAQLELYYYVN